VFRVDVLNVMGPSMVAAGLLWAVTGRAEARALVFAAFAALVAMFTPVVRAAEVVDALPLWLQWYVRPAGEFTTFTLFPWAGFVFAGAAAGALMTAGAETRLRVAFGLGGAALIAIGWYGSSRATIYTVPVWFWTSSPSWFAIRVGIMLVALAALSAVAAGLVGRVGRVGLAGLVGQVGHVGSGIARFGRASLFVYWIHVELVYGYASWLWRQRLPAWGSVAAWLLFTALMYGTVVLRDRYRARRRAVAFPGAVALSQA
jgi:uncharacterized membrane protein